MDIIKLQSNSVQFQIHCINASIVVQYLNPVNMFLFELTF